MLEKLIQFIHEDRIYFATGKDLIHDQNNHILSLSCVMYGVVLAFYTLLVTLTPRFANLRMMYYAADMVHVLLCFGVYGRSEKQKADHRTTQTYCSMLEMDILIFFALEGAVTSRTEPALYIPIAILLIIVLFIHRIGYMTILLVTYLGLFVTVSVMYKVPEAYINDIYIAIATALSSIIGYFMTGDLRHHEALAINRYSHLKQIDVLTDTLNKDTMEALTKEKLNHTDGHIGYLILEVDHFNELNDSYGHAFGDLVLRNIADLLRKYLEGCTIGRIRGYQFVVLIEDASNAMATETKIREAMEGIVRLSFEEAPVAVSCCGGLAIQGRYDTYHTIYQRAEDALAAAKQNGLDSLRVDVNSPK